MDITDITDFLPKYPNINPYTQDIFNPYDNEFYENIYKKKEFYDQRLDAEEDFPEQAGELMKHQKIIARFFSSYTPYDSLLLLHAMGTGKSCSAIGAVEAIKNQDTGFKRAYYLAKGTAILENFKQEIAFKCTDGRYIPEDYYELTKGQQVTRLNKSLDSYYSFDTFDKFAKKIKGMSMDMIRERYNNSIIVIDEVHNLRIKKDKKGLNIYDEFWKFLHTIQGCKIMLLSGTPMKDEVTEIAAIMNLILPVNEQLPTETDFLKTYFDIINTDRPPVLHRENATTWNIYRLKNDMQDVLKEKLKGRISFLTTMPSKVTKIMEGNHAGSLKHFNVVENMMSPFQTEAYNRAYQQDISGDKSGIYDQSRQASLFVFPNGSWGSAGFKKYIKVKSKGLSIGDDGARKQLSSFSMQSELRDALNGSTTEEKLNKLFQFSTIYYASIVNILSAQKEGKCVFVFNRFVEGSGLILFGLILELFGFTKGSSNIGERSEAPRYVVLTDKTISSGQIKNVIERFNKPDNARGKIINVIIGSSILKEGFSFQNIQVEEIQNPWFNYSEIAQAIARGYRLGSHRYLIGVGINPQLSVYQRIAVPDPTLMDPPVSIDLYMYELSERKDISIKGVERVMKEASFDCALNFNRNRLYDVDDGDRNCEYLECDYECDGIQMQNIDTLEPDELDFSTFQLYYSMSNIDDIINEIISLYKYVFSIDLTTFYLYFTEYTKFEILSALYIMINKNIPIKNKYGFVAYIKESNNIFFLIDSLSVIGGYSTDYYSEYPTIIVDTNFYQIIDNIYQTKLPQIIEQMCASTDQNIIKQLLLQIPIELHEDLIESSILARKINKNANIAFRNIILEYFDSYYKEIDGVWVSWYLYEDMGILRCLKSNTWENCTDEYDSKILNLRKEKKKDLETNPYGYYALYNPNGGHFCIRDVSKPIPEKKHKVTTGRVCGTFDAKDLYNLAINKLNIPIPDNINMNTWLPALSNSNRKYARISSKDINNSKILWTHIVSRMKGISNVGASGAIQDESGNSMYNAQTVPLMSPDKIHQVIYWGSKKREPLCVELLEWFRKENLIQEDYQCGATGGKVKKET